MDNTIRFTVIENGTKQVINTYVSEYRNLMFLLKEKLGIDGFGECGGMGRCATCIVIAIGMTGDALTMDRNEPVTLAKAGYNEKNVRLSCQIYINKDLDGAEIEILEIE